MGPPRRIRKLSIAARPAFGILGALECDDKKHAPHQAMSSPGISAGGWSDCMRASATAGSRLPVFARRGAWRSGLRSISAREPNARETQLIERHYRPASPRNRPQREFCSSTLFSTIPPRPMVLRWLFCLVLGAYRRGSAESCGLHFCPFASTLWAIFSLQRDSLRSPAWSVLYRPALCIFRRFRIRALQSGGKFGWIASMHDRYRESNVSWRRPPFGRSGRPIT
jgi:hypothetical protein